MIIEYIMNYGDKQYHASKVRERYDIIYMISHHVKPQWAFYYCRHVNDRKEAWREL